MRVRAIALRFHPCGYWMDYSSDIYLPGNVLDKSGIGQDDPDLAFNVQRFHATWKSVAKAIVTTQTQRLAESCKAHPYRRPKSLIVRSRVFDA
ncbi:MAG: hypothetical protein LBO79_01460 [Zoogloeaceae bacterium]|jgi:hypothetical protein|nr:hypothetical protein [Zoogloeaceae bacterium]